MEGVDSTPIIQALKVAFSEAVSWTKASSTCRFRFEVLGIGLFESGSQITVHSHPSYELGLGLLGEGRLLLGREEKTLLQGSLYVVEPDTVHRVSACSKEPFCGFIFHVTPESFGDGNRKESLPGIDTSKSLQNEDLADMMHSWAKVNRHQLADPVSLSLFTRYLAFEMLTLLSRGDECGSWSLIEKARIEIEKILPGKLDVRSLSERLGVGERTLRRHFQNQLGKSVIEYVNERRIDLAERYLSLHLSVAAVSKAVGFESASQLSRLFQKAKGVSPKTWQQSVAPTRRAPKPGTTNIPK